MCGRHPVVLLGVVVVASAATLVVGLVVLAGVLVVLATTVFEVVVQFVYPVSEVSEDPFVGVAAVAGVIVPHTLEQLLVEGVVRVA